MTIDHGRQAAAAGRAVRLINLENALAEIEKGQQLAGHFPDDEAMNRARRSLNGEATEDAAVEEILRKYRKA